MMIKDEDLPHNINQIIMPEFLKVINGLEKPVSDPPIEFKHYDSEIEDIFIHTIAKYLKDDVKIIPQFEVHVPMEFRIDFVLEQSGKYIGIECDGKDFHNLYKDIIRDALILKSACIDPVFRFPGNAIFYCVNNCIFFIYNSFPDLFKEDLIINLLSLTDKSFIDQYEYNKYLHEEYHKDEGPFENVSTFLFHLCEEDGYENEFQFVLHERYKRHLNLYDCDWMKLYQFVSGKEEITQEDMYNYFEDYSPFSGF
ncbi:MAG: hypothetical protein JXR78_14905 [Victivallales bacterium]|nr:hypothetical protein [Victivallales bacterium]